MTSLGPSFEVDSDIRQARTLPASAFESLSVAERERQAIHQKGFHLLPPHTVPVTPRSSHPTKLSAVPLVLTRSSDCTLRALSNVCTHAWYPVATKPSSSKFLTCGQHGRRFDLEGTAISQMGFDSSCGFPAAEDNLSAFSVQELGPLNFVGLGSEDTSAWRSFSAPWSDELAHYPLNELHYAPRNGESRTLEGNWKQHAWNYLDSFHIPFIHRGPKGLVDAIDYKSYTTEIYPDAVLQWAWSKNPEYGLPSHYAPERLRHPEKRLFALWWFIWPNLTLNFYPWGLSVNRYGLSLDNPAECEFEWYHYILDDELYEKADTIWLNDQVDQEDVDAMALVRENIQSGCARRARFSPSEEKAPHWFHHRVSQALTQGTF